MGPFSLTIRRDSAGGGITREPFGTKYAFIPRDRLILLIHGYNVDLGSAESAYRKFRQLIEVFSPSLHNEIGEVHWPGDERLPGLSALSYPFQVGQTIPCAELLVEYLKDLHQRDGGFTKIAIVAHSLGCRLTLETLTRFAELGEAAGHDIDIFLMAAAVPVSSVESSGPLRNAVTRSRRRTVFYSSADRVLSRYFVAGQFVAPGEGHILGRAIGNCGLPEDLWTDRFEVFDYDHGDYWSSGQIAQFVAYSLGLPTTRPLLDRSLPESRPLVDSLVERELPVV